MRTIRNILACVLFLSMGTYSSAVRDAVAYYDSLVSVLDKTAQDTSRLKLLETISIGHYNVDSTIKYAQFELDLARKLHQVRYEANALRYLGWAAYYNNDYVASVGYNLDAIVLSDSVGDKMGMAMGYVNLGTSYSMMLDAAKSNEYFFKAYDIYVELNDSSLITDVLRNIGHNEVDLEMYAEAENMFHRALQIDEKCNRFPAVCEDYYGLAYVAYGKYMRYMYVAPQDSLLDIAKHYSMDAYSNASKYQNYQNLYVDCNNLASTMLYQLDNRDYSPQRRREIIDSCQFFLDKSLKIIQMLDYDGEELDVAMFRSRCYLADRQFEKAKALVDSVADIVYSDVDYYSDRVGLLHHTYIAYYRATGNNAEAFRYMAKLHDYDLTNKKISDVVASAQGIMMSDFEHKMKQKEMEAVRREAVNRVVGISGLVIIILALASAISIGISSYRRKRINQQLDIKNIELEQQKEEILSQNEYLEEQQEFIERQKSDLERQNKIISANNRQLTDSINYASVIQRAAMPSERTMRNIFGDNLVIFRPLQTVSGDFFWAAQAGKYKMIAVGDCTGHGVPGAFLSMLGMAILDNVTPLVVHGEISAGVILDRMRVIFKHSLNQDNGDDDNHDGIDIALAIIDLENMKMHCAGAFRPVVMFRDGEMKKFDGDRMPLGVHMKESEHFTDHEVDLMPNDVIYLFTDGMTDQFGYDESRNIHKYTAKRLRNLLSSVCRMPFSSQKLRIEMDLDNWRMNGVTATGDLYEQTDDALLVGIRI